MNKPKKPAHFLPVAYLCTRHLIGQHVRLHSIEYCMKRGKCSGWIFQPDKVVPYHEEIVEEMKRRGISHESPLQVPLPIDHLPESYFQYKQDDQEALRRMSHCKRCHKQFLAIAYGLDG